MIPSLLQIPSAVSDSKLHSVLPNNGKGDFTFDRSTGATRINKDGLIEEVGYFSSELVQNGNFSELGSEALINGDFATDSDWSKGTGWVIMNGYAESDGTNAPLDQVSRLTIGKTYKVVITVTNMTSSALSVRLGTSSSNAVLSISENGTYTAYGVAGATTFRLRSQGFDGRIQNVSVKQVDPNDRWTLGTGWSYGDGVANCDGSQSANSLFFQNIGVLANKTVKFTFTVSNYSAGQVSTSFFGASGTTTHNVTANGEYSFVIDVQSGHNGNSGFTANSSFIGTVDNVSIKEVQGDRPRLSYDITNGVVEKQPHLLLEPSSTNLVTFSEDYTQSLWTKENITVTSNAVISPDGTQNASILTDTSTNGQHRITTSALFSADGNNRVFSVFVKKGTSRYCAFNHVAGFTSSVNTVIFDFDTASYVATGTTTYIDELFTPKHYGNGWYKIAFRSDINSSAYNRLSIGLSNGTSYIDASYAGTGATVFVWGGQVEQQSYCTSYIPTAGTTITRAAETCNNSKPSINSTEGVFYGELFSVDEPTSKFIAISDGTDDNRIAIYYHSSNNNITTQVRASNSEQFSRETSGISREQFNKIAVLYKANEFKMYVNGNQIGTTDTSGSVPSGLNTVAFDRGDGGEDFYGKVKGLAVYNEALSESQLMQLTGVTASSIYNNFVTRTASFTVEALNEVKKVIDNL